MKNNFIPSRKIVIYETKNCDTRALEPGKKLNESVVRKDTLNHIFAVISCGAFLRECITTQFLEHDHTKIEPDVHAFTEALSTGLVGEEFKKLDWWKIHLQERHHLNDRVPDDVNLIDVLEMISDCVSAGMARTGKVYDIKLSDEVLQKAVKNTVNMLIEHIEVIK